MIFHYIICRNVFVENINVRTVLGSWKENQLYTIGTSLGGVDLQTRLHSAIRGARLVIGIHA